MDKLRRRLTSISTKQRFGEVLALVLIVGLMGLLVYLMIPTHAAAPKVAPLTVRSNASFAMQHQAAPSTYRAPATTSSDSQANVVANRTPQFAASEQQATHRNVSHAISNQKVQAAQIAQATLNTQTRVSTACTGVTKPIGATLTKVGSILHLSSLTSDVVSGTSSCQ